MPEATEPQFMRKKVDDTIERLVQHQLRWPCDLIDVRHLMLRFQASAAEFLQVVGRLEEAALHPSRKGTCRSWMVYK